MSLKIEPDAMISSLTPPPPPQQQSPVPTAPSITPPPAISTTTLLSTQQTDALPTSIMESPRIAQPPVNGNSNGTPNTTTPPSRPTEEVARGPLGLTADEEEWVRSKMEYALHDFEVLALAIKRYKWQLNQVPKDVDRLQSLKEKHMEDPYEFLRQLKTKEFRYPEGQKTLPVPSIEWSKYQFPPANPIVPAKPATVGFLGSSVFASSTDRSSNIVSLNSSGVRSRAGSPSNERMRAVKDTARSLGIHISRSSSSSASHRPQSALPRHYPSSQDINGSTAIRIEGSVYAAEDAQNLPKYDPTVPPPTTVATSNTTAIVESRPLSRQTSQEVIPQEREYSHTPSTVVVHSNDMEGVVYNSGQTIAVVPRARSTTVTENTTIQHFHAAQSASLTQHAYAATVEPKIEGASYVIQHNLDPNFGLGSVAQNSNLQNRNITINHMSGSVVDIQPSIAAASSASSSKTKAAASREGSGTREEPPKPPLFNIPWSDDEQRLLEKLLDEYPDEPVAAQRFQKISAAMGTRTPKQVASRVQKYFIKLVKAGLEAPGRMNYSLEPTKPKPKGASPTKGKKRKEGPPEGTTPKPKANRSRKKEEGGAGGPRSSSSAPSTKKQKPKSLLGSGFGRTSGTQYLNYSAAPTVYMSEEDDEENVQDMMGVSNNYGTPAPSDGVVSHIGFACDSCGVEPILGTRYSCMNCEEYGGTDLCGPCFYSGNYQTEYHLVSHRFQTVDTAETPAYGSDYGRPSSAGPSNSVYHS